MSAFSVENPHDGKTFENYSRFEWGVEVGVVTSFMLRLFVLHEFDMPRQKWTEVGQDLKSRDVVLVIAPKTHTKRPIASTWNYAPYVL